MQLLLRLPVYYLASTLLSRAGLSVLQSVALFAALELLWFFLSRQGTMSSNIEGLQIIENAETLAPSFRQIAALPSTSEVRREACRVEVSKGKTLRAVFFAPANRSGPHSKIALVCTHPWAVMGGDMNNNVPDFLARKFAALGFLTVKFNFRSGTITRGNGEIEDVVAVCRHLQALDDPPTSIYLLGYSYGSMIANACVDELDIIKGFVGISTYVLCLSRCGLLLWLKSCELVCRPFSVFWALSLFNGHKLLKKSHSSKPKLLLTGSEDNFTSKAVCCLSTSSPC